MTCVTHTHTNVHWLTYSSRSSRPVMSYVPYSAEAWWNSPAMRHDESDRRPIVTPVCPAWLGDEHVVRAHIPHASTTVSEQHATAGANTRRPALPTLNRVSRGLSRRAPPITRRARRAGKLFLQAGRFRHTLTFAREEFFQQERMRPPVISWRHR